MDTESPKTPGGRIRGGLDLAKLEAMGQDAAWWSLSRVIQEGRHPNRVELAGLIDEALRQTGAPDDVREYVVGRIRDPDEYRLPEGRAGLSDSHRERRAEELHWLVRLFQASFRMQSIPNPRGLAMERAAGLFDLTASSVNAFLKRDRSEGPRRHFEEELAEAEDWISEATREGFVQLDPKEGLVWLATRGGNVTP